MAHAITFPIGAAGSVSSTGQNLAGFQALTETSTVKRYPLGTKVKAIDPTYGEAEFIYAQGVASTAAGDACLIQGNFTTTRAVARGKGLVGVAMSANVANQYGWYAVRGVVAVNAGTVAAAAPAYLTATAGTLDDAVVAGDAIPGASFATADGTPGSGQAMIRLNESATLDWDAA